MEDALQRQLILAQQQQMMMQSQAYAAAAGAAARGMPVDPAYSMMSSMGAPMPYSSAGIGLDPSTTPMGTGLGHAATTGAGMMGALALGGVTWWGMSKGWRNLGAPTAAILPGMLDPITAGMHGFFGGMRRSLIRAGVPAAQLTGAGAIGQNLGRLGLGGWVSGIGGGLLRAGVMAAPAIAAASFVSSGVRNMAAGATQFSQMQSVMHEILPGTGITSDPTGNDIMGMLSQQDRMVQFSDNPTAARSDIMGLMRTAGVNREFSDTRSVQGFQTKFASLVKETKAVASLLDTSLSEAYSMMKSFGQFGIRSGEGQRAALGVSVFGSAGAGLSQQSVLQSMGIGSQLGKSMGMSRGSGAMMLGQMTTGLGYSMLRDKGLEARIFEATGMGREQAAVALPAMWAQAGAQIGQAPMMQYLLAGMVDPSGNLSQYNVSKYLSGQGDMKEFLKHAETRMKDPRTQSILATRGQELYGQLYQSLGQKGMLQAASRFGASIGMSPEASIQQLTGMSAETYGMMSSQMGNLGVNSMRANTSALVTKIQGMEDQYMSDMINPKKIAGRLWQEATGWIDETFQTMGRDIMKGVQERVQQYTRYLENQIAEFAPEQINTMLQDVWAGRGPGDFGRGLNILAGTGGSTLKGRGGMEVTPGFALQSKYGGYGALPNVMPATMGGLGAYGPKLWGLSKGPGGPMMGMTGAMPVSDLSVFASPTQRAMLGEFYASPGGGSAAGLFGLGSKAVGAGAKSLGGGIKAAGGLLGGPLTKLGGLSSALGGALLGISIGEGVYSGIQYGENAYAMNQLSQAGYMDWAAKGVEYRGGARENAIMPSPFISNALSPVLGSIQNVRTNALRAGLATTASSLTGGLLSEQFLRSYNDVADPLSTKTTFTLGAQRDWTVYGGTTDVAAFQQRMGDINTSFPDLATLDGKVVSKEEFFYAYDKAPKGPTGRPAVNGALGLDIAAARKLDPGGAQRAIQAHRTRQARIAEAELNVRIFDPGEATLPFQYNEGDKLKRTLVSGGEVARFGESFSLAHGMLTGDTGLSKSYRTDVQNYVKAQTPEKRARLMAGEWTDEDIRAMSAHGAGKQIAGAPWAVGLQKVTELNITESSPFFNRALGGILGANTQKSARAGLGQILGSVAVEGSVAPGSRTTAGYTEAMQNLRLLTVENMGGFKEAMKSFFPDLAIEVGRDAELAKAMSSPDAMVRAAAIAGNKALAPRWAEIQQYFKAGADSKTASVQYLDLYAGFTASQSGEAIQARAKEISADVVKHDLKRQFAGISDKRLSGALGGWLNFQEKLARVDSVEAQSLGTSDEATRVKNQMLEAFSTADVGSQHVTLSRTQGVAGLADTFQQFSGVYGFGEMGRTYARDTKDKAADRVQALQSMFGKSIGFSAADLQMLEKGNAVTADMRVKMEAAVDPLKKLQEEERKHAANIGLQWVRGAYDKSEVDSAARLGELGKFHIRGVAGDESAPIAKEAAIDTAALNRLISVLGGEGGGLAKDISDLIATLQSPPTQRLDINMGGMQFTGEIAPQNGKSYKPARELPTVAGSN